MNDKTDVAASTQSPSAAESGTPNGRSWPPWRKMDEEQPEDNQQVLFWYSGECFLGAFSASTMRFYVGGKMLLQSRYWLPAPSSPYGEGAPATAGGE